MRNNYAELNPQSRGMRKQFRRTCSDFVHAVNSAKTKQMIRFGFLLVALATTFSQAQAAELPATAHGSFPFCGSGKRMTCVVDGDTFWLGGLKVRIADIDTAELEPPHCAYERDRGLAAKARLRALLNSGPITFRQAGRDEDRYGRKLRLVFVGGQSVGKVLIGEGLARPWTGRRQPWCGG
ncbi:thermonuclease family protein [Rhizobium leguminosarum]|uniref:thermonuclease family protein n=1 Tax=Rhizobium ruizarguesonis TaxID=2081791 RepID=UPI0013BAB05A|nr:thermonuclease family protein [Rhizobium ruizarguesonis]NEJ10453.1 thermonuclease family protein [Rhizobium ruizarguesonis]